jgi:hypothetical protein
LSDTFSPDFFLTCGPPALPVDDKVRNKSAAPTPPPEAAAGGSLGVEVLVFIDTRVEVL